jgi:hypothetical protein
MLAWKAHAATTTILTGFSSNLNTYSPRLEYTIPPESSHTIFYKYHHSRKT